MVGDEVAVFVDGGFVVVCKGRDVRFGFEEVVGVSIDFVFGCCGEAKEAGVEVVEDCPVFFEDASVCFVQDYEVEVCGAEAGFAVFYFVDGVEDCGVGGEDDSCGGVFFVFEEVAAGDVF